MLEARYFASLVKSVREFNGLVKITNDELKIVIITVKLYVSVTQTRNS